MVTSLEAELDNVLKYLGVKNTEISVGRGPMTTLIRAAEHCQCFPYFNGKDAESRALVWQWLESTMELRDGNFDKFLKNLELHLTRQVFVSGDTLTIADIVLFFCLKSLVRNMTHQERQTRFNNLCRWFDNIQETAGVIDKSQKIAIFKNNVYIS